MVGRLGGVQVLFARIGRGSGVQDECWEQGLLLVGWLGLARGGLAGHSGWWGGTDGWGVHGAA